MAVNPGRWRHWVTLGDIASDQPQGTYVPNRVKCYIVPQAPSNFDESRTSVTVEMRYNPQVTFNTRLTYVDKHDVTHEFYVRGIQNVDMADRYLVLACEEVLPR